MTTLSRRLLLRSLPVAPAVAKQAVGGIINEAAGKAVGLMSGGDARPVGYGAGVGPDNWTKLHKWVQKQILAGKFPPHKMREMKRYARHRARQCEDHDIEALGSISAGARGRMHERSALNQIMKAEIDDIETSSIYEKLFGQMEKGLLE